MWQKNGSAWRPGAAVKPTPRQPFPRQAGLWLCLFPAPTLEKLGAPRSLNKPSVPQQLRLTKLMADDDKHSGFDGCQTFSQCQGAQSGCHQEMIMGGGIGTLAPLPRQPQPSPREAGRELGTKAFRKLLTPRSPQQAFCLKQPVNAWQGLSSNS